MSRLRRLHKCDLRLGKNSLWVIRSHTRPLRTKGEYLFFSTDPDALLVVASQEVALHGFPAAQILPWSPRTARQRVMRLYSKYDSRGPELYRRYGDAKGLEYARWKSHRKSLGGKYSKKYLDTLPPEKRRRLVLGRSNRKFRSAEGEIIMVQRRGWGEIR